MEDHHRAPRPLNIKTMTWTTTPFLLISRDSKMFKSKLSSDKNLFITNTLTTSQDRTSWSASKKLKKKQVGKKEGVRWLNNFWNIKSRQKQKLKTATRMWFSVKFSRMSYQRKLSMNKSCTRNSRLNSEPKLYASKKSRWSKQKPCSRRSTEEFWMIKR